MQMLFQVSDKINRACSGLLAEARQEDSVVAHTETTFKDPAETGKLRPNKLKASIKLQTASLIWNLPRNSGWC